MYILSIGTSLFEVLPLFSRKSHYLKIVRFFHSFVDSCIWTICHHKDFTGRLPLWEIYISARNNLFHTQRRFFLARYRSPNKPHLLRMLQPIRSPENPGTTVVSIGHLTPWPENLGYRTQVWDNTGFHLFVPPSVIRGPSAIRFHRCLKHRNRRGGSWLITTIFQKSSFPVFFC